MDEYTLTEASIKRLSREIRILENNFRNVPHTIRALIASEVGDYVPPPPKPLWIWNTEASETCPAYGLLACHDAIQNGTGQNVSKGKKSSTTFYRNYHVAGTAPIAAGATYKAQTGRQVLLAYDPSATPTNGKSYGPKPGEWVAFENFPGFICEGVVDEDNHIMLATREEITHLRCVAKEDIALGATGTVEILANDTPTTIEIEDASGEFYSCKEDDILIIAFIAGVPTIIKVFSENECVGPTDVGLPSAPGSGSYALTVVDGCLTWEEIGDCE